MRGVSAQRGPEIKRAPWMVLLLVLFASPAWAAAAHVEYILAASGGSPEACTVTFTGGTTAGNSIAVFVMLGAPATRTHTVADGTNTWGSPRVNIVGATVNEQVALFDIHNAAAVASITVTQGGGSEVAFGCYAVEFTCSPVACEPDPAGAGAGSCAITTGSCDTFEQGANVDLYGSDDAGGLLDLSAGAYVFAASHGTINNGGYNVLGSYTMLSAGGASRNFAMYGLFAGGSTDEPGRHQQSATRRAQLSAIAAYSPVAAVGGARTLGLLGVGQ